MGQALQASRPPFFFSQIIFILAIRNLETAMIQIEFISGVSSYQNPYILIT
jgi:hypothetical protein